MKTKTQNSTASNAEKYCKFSRMICSLIAKNEEVATLQSFPTGVEQRAFYCTANCNCNLSVSHRSR